MSYLEENRRYWESNEYEAANVDHAVFRFHGRILGPEFGIKGDNTERLLDFGCGQGSAVDYFNRHGYDVHGVDISQSDLQVAKYRYPGIKNRFHQIDPQPTVADQFIDAGWDVIIAINSLYYYSDSDLQARLISLERNLNPGGVLFATMIGTEYEKNFNESVPVGDGLRKVKVDKSNPRSTHHYINFTESESDLKNKFDLFDAKHIGFFSERFRSDEGAGFHFTYVGTKSNS